MLCRNLLLNPFHVREVVLVVQGTEVQLPAKNCLEDRLSKPGMFILKTVFGVRQQEKV